MKKKEFRLLLIVGIVLLCASVFALGTAIYKVITVEDNKQVSKQVEETKEPSDTLNGTEEAKEIKFTEEPEKKPEFTDEIKEKMNKEISVLLSKYQVTLAKEVISEVINTYEVNEEALSMEKARIDEYEKFQTDLEPYTGIVEHMFTHCLIAFPEICYSSPSMMKALDTDCITPHEFKGIIQNLYEKDYILIDINLLVNNNSVSGQSITINQLMLPKGKKPLVFSIDDVVYDARKASTGMVDKLIVDDEGRVCTYTKHKDGTEVISYDNEIFPILDQFVIEHPEFSFRGAKGTLALTGFQGILGYRTQNGAPEGTDYNKEKESALKVVAALKEYGWNFASHSYGHGHMNKKMSLASVKEDTNAWLNEVAPLVGGSQIFIYPYGETIKSTDTKHDVLLNAGFKLFAGVGRKSAYLGLLKDNKGILQDRRSLDGYSLRNTHDIYLQFFDTNEIMDPLRPKNPVN